MFSFPNLGVARHLTPYHTKLVFQSSKFFHTLLNHRAGWDFQRHLGQLNSQSSFNCCGIRVPNSPRVTPNISTLVPMHVAGLCISCQMLRADILALHPLVSGPDPRTPIFAFRISLFPFPEGWRVFLPTYSKQTWKSAALKGGCASRKQTR